jgi:ABC-type sugar transport system substrate-binding protein
MSALANGATACMSASSDMKLMFKGILAAETERKAGAQAMNRGLAAAAKAAGGSSSSSSGSGSACKQQRSLQNTYEVSVY